MRIIIAFQHFIIILIFIPFPSVSIYFQNAAFGRPNRPVSVRFFNLKPLEA